MRFAVVAPVAVLVAACSSEDAMVVTRTRDTGIADDTSVVADEGAPGDASDESESDARDPNLNCVKPGSPGNELGIGAYCEKQADCHRVDGGPPLLCTAAFSSDPYAWFCTTPCSSPTECGSGATCVDSPDGSGCVPFSCTDSDASVDADADAD